MQSVEDAFFSLPVTSKKMAILTRGEALVLVGKLREIGQLGRNASRADRDIAALVERQHLLEALLSLGSAESLKERLTKEVATFTKDAQIVYLVVALAHACGHRVSLAVTRRAAAISVPQLLAMLKADLRDSVHVVDGKWLETRHRVVAEVLTKQIDRASCFDAAVRLAQSLAPYVSRRAIMRGEPEARLSGRLLDYDNVAKLFDASDIRRFYDQIKNDWSWNSRYWEQCALMEVDTDPELALRHAEHAVGIELHPVPLTTLASIRVRVARSKDFRDAALFWSGIDAAREAVNLSKRWYRHEIHPYDVAIRGAIDFAGSLAKKGHNVSRWEGWKRIDDFADDLGRFHTKDARVLLESWVDTKKRFAVG